MVTSVPSHARSVCSRHRACLLTSLMELLLMFNGQHEWLTFTLVGRQNESRRQVSSSVRALKGSQSYAWHEQLSHTLGPDLIGGITGNWHKTDH